MALHKQNALKFYMECLIETKNTTMQEDMAVTPHLLDETVNTGKTEVKVFKNKELLEYQKSNCRKLLSYS